MMKRFIITLEALTLCISMSYAAIIEGTCGENLTWSLNTKDSTLTVDGSGEMSNWLTISKVPWYEYRSYIAKVIVEENITSIGNIAFDECENLTFVSMPNTIATIGDYAFAKCKKITTISIPYNVIKIGHNAFDACRSLQSIDIPNSVTSIGNFLCRDCNSIISVSLSENVNSIPQAAFCGCSCIASISIPQNVTNIGAGAFQNCTNLKSLDLGDNIVTIGSSAFANCSNLETISIPNSTTSIGKEAFQNCYSLTQVTIPRNVETVSKNAFAGCVNLTSVIWNAINCVTEGSSPFENANYSYLTTIIFGDEVEVIPSYLLCYMYKIEEIIIPQSVKIIGAYSLQGTSLSSIQIPNSVTTISFGAFLNCKNLKIASIGGGIKAIQEDAFKGSNIEKLIVNAVDPPEAMKSGINPSKCILYVPTESVELYSNTLWWEDFIEIKPIQESATSVDFYDEHQKTFNKIICEGQVHVKSGDKTYTLQGQVIR